MLKTSDIDKFKKIYQKKGYVLVKNFLDKKNVKKLLDGLIKKIKKN